MKVALTADGRVSAAAPGVRTRADRRGRQPRHSPRACRGGRAGGRVGHLLVDDPLLTPRGAYRHRPLTRVVFDRRLTHARRGAELFSTLAAGPVIIVTTAASQPRRQGGRWRSRRPEPRWRPWTPRLSPGGRPRAGQPARRPRASGRGRHCLDDCRGGAEPAPGVLGRGARRSRPDLSGRPHVVGTGRRPVAAVGGRRPGVVAGAHDERSARTC